MRGGVQSSIWVATRLESACPEIGHANFIDRLLKYDNELRLRDLMRNTQTKAFTWSNALLVYGELTSTSWHIQ